MELSVIDIFIIVCYLLTMIVIGLILKKRASKDLDSYFLGGKSLPYYMLGISDAWGCSIFRAQCGWFILPLSMALKVCGFLGYGLSSIRFS